MSERHPLIQADELAPLLGSPNIVVFDASYHLAVTGRDARAEYVTAHIPGARFFDIDAVADEGTELPHMLPSPGRFAAQVARLGVGPETLVVAYDTERIFGAARVWWTFRVFGHSAVAVLDGGLQAWRAAGHPVEAGEALTQAASRALTPRFRRELVWDAEQVQANITRGGALLVDVRSRERFEGLVDEPRPGLTRGHIPGSRNLPWTDLLDPETGRMLPAEGIRAQLAHAGVDPSRPLVSLCGSGISAAVLALALYGLGIRDVPVYDGSWAEWGRPGGA